MVSSDVTNYIQPLYNWNNNFDKFSGEDSNALHFSASLSFPERLFRLLLEKSRFFEERTILFKLRINTTYTIFNYLDYYFINKVVVCNWWHQTLPHGLKLYSNLMNLFL